KEGRLNVPVIGVAKGGGSLQSFQARAEDSVRQHGGGVDPTAFPKLAQRLRYVDGDYSDPKTFDPVRRDIGEARPPLNYLGIPQGLFEMVVDQLERSGCAADARLVLEKPFGTDLASAHRLNQLLHQHFEEPEIFRIDHYLGKEAVQNLVFFR